MEFDNLFNLEELDAVIASNRDPDRKEVGDRVVIIDYSSTTHLNGNELDIELDDDFDLNFNTELIVIETRQNHIYDSGYSSYKQNLVVVNSLTNKQFRINSGHVKLKT
jgi:hypothetical protein